MSFFGVAEVLIRPLPDALNRSSILSPIKKEVKKTLHIAVKIVKLKIKIQISFVPQIFGFIASPSLMSVGLFKRARDAGTDFATPLEQVI